MTVLTAAQKAADALEGSATSRTVPAEDGAEAMACLAVARVVNDGTNSFQVIKNGSNQVTKIKVGTVGGTLGDVLSHWTPLTPGGTSGTWDGLQER